MCKPSPDRVEKQREHGKYINPSGDKMVAGCFLHRLCELALDFHLLVATLASLRVALRPLKCQMVLGEVVYWMETLQMCHILRLVLWSVCSKGNQASVLSVCWCLCKRNIVFQNSPVRFHINWWEVKLNIPPKKAPSAKSSSAPYGRPCSTPRRTPPSRLQLEPTRSDQILLLSIA